MICNRLSLCPVSFVCLLTFDFSFLFFFYWSLRVVFVFLMHMILIVMHCLTWGNENHGEVVNTRRVFTPDKHVTAQMTLDCSGLYIWYIPSALSCDTPLSTPPPPVAPTPPQSHHITPEEKAHPDASCRLGSWWWVWKSRRPVRNARTCLRRLTASTCWRKLRTAPYHRRWVFFFGSLRCAALRFLFIC